MKARGIACAVAILGLWSVSALMAADDPQSTKPAEGASWLAQPDVFPIAVWLQDPKNAARYAELGVNVYVALYRGPTDEQMAALRKQDMHLVSGQSERSLAYKNDPLVVAWMHGDEPDNAQSLGEGKGWGPPVPPEEIVADYRKLKARDPSRPVLLNLGQGVAWDGWYGRGVRTNHPEDYPRYIEGCDIVSFDIYPAVHDKPEVAGRLWYVARGVERLRRWTESRKPVWNCIECTRISNEEVKPTPAQVKAEVWMSIIHGSQGLIYFCHQFQPRFIEAGLLADEEMCQAVGAVNRQIHALASVIRSPAVEDAVRVNCEPATVSPELAKAMNAQPVAWTVRKHDGATYIFAVRMEDAPAKATFRFHQPPQGSTVEVLGEDRTIKLDAGGFADEFGPYAVHLYRVK